MIGQAEPQRIHRSFTLIGEHDHRGVSDTPLLRIEVHGDVDGGEVWMSGVGEALVGPFVVDLERLRILFGDRSVQDTGIIDADEQQHGPRAECECSRPPGSLPSDPRDAPAPTPVGLTTTHHEERCDEEQAYGEGEPICPEE